MNMQLLSEQDYTALIADARVLSRDHMGDKVFELSDGSILKLFRIKRAVTSARIRNYAQRFAGNAKRLQRLGIPTVMVDAVYNVPHIERQAVLYRPLVGTTLRDRMRADFDQAVLNRYAEFIAALHDKGVYFRAMHMNNVLLCEDGSFGIIDMADMWIWPWHVGLWKSLRNFRHILNHNEADILWQTNMSHFRQHYLAARHLNPLTKLLLRRKLPAYMKLPSPV
jgi:tRNA A-37 threonylcarbamoyl transferase component Bud32